MQPTPISVVISSLSLLSVEVVETADAVESSASWLANQPYVLFVEPAPLAHAHNADAVPIMYGRGISLEDPIGSQHPNLDGYGEVVVASDTGVFNDSCALFPPAYS
jgi:hypothetical protein